MIAHHELESEVHLLLSDAEDILTQRKGIGNHKIHRILRAIVVPHGAYNTSGIIAAQGFCLLSKFSRHDHWKVLLIGPSHTLYFPGAAVSTVPEWQTPLGAVPIHQLAAFMAKQQYPALIDLSEAHDQEHSLKVQLPFLMNVLSDFSIIPIVTGEIDAEKLSAIIEPYCDDETIIVISADLSHNHTYDRARRQDAITTKSLIALDAQRLERYGETCGKIPLIALVHLAKKKGWTGELVDCMNSGDTTQNKKRVVGYGCFAFYEGSGS